MAPRERRIGPGDWAPALGDADGPQLVVAGPGTGKTEFLVQRVAHLVATGAARRDEIALLTFSRRAAADLRRRVEAMLGSSGVPIEASTFHSLALRLLEAGNQATRPLPLTTPEQIAVVADLLHQERPEDWPVLYRGVLGTPGFASEVADFLIRCSERLLTPDDLESRVAVRPDWRGIPGLFRRYRRTLEESGRTDYGTLLVSTVELLSDEVGRRLAGHYRYVVVDEYQDTTPAQAEMARLLAGEQGNLTVAADPYQSIYSFRGAEVRNVARFEADHPDAVRIVLEKSFRVPAEILGAAVRIISGGELPGATGPVLPADHPGRVETYVFDQETGEAEWIAADIERMVRVEGIPPEKIAVLVRSKREMVSQLSRALARREIPHDPPRSQLVEHPAVRLIHDLVTAAEKGGQPAQVTPAEAAEADRAVRRLLLGPLVGAGLGQEREMLRARRRSGGSWPGILSTRLPELAGLIQLLSDPVWATERSAIDGFWEVWSRLEGWERIVSDPWRADWRLALTSFSQVLARQAERDPTLSLARFFRLGDEEGLEATPLLSYRPEERRVTLTTLHQAKGLEFEVVYIANAVEGVFPDLRRGRRMLRPELLSPDRVTDPAAQHLFQVQEEMRLAYTAMTRARRRVVWTATEAGVDQGEHRPSRFLRAAADPAAGPLGRPPTDPDQIPVTLSEAEVRLRRTLLDPAANRVARLAAAHLLARPPSPWWDAGAFAGAPRRGPDRPVLPPQPTLSPSQAEAYTTCPRRYALERRLRLGDGGSPYAHFGELVHEALERAETEVLGSGRAHADLEAALGHLERVWAEMADFGTPELDEAWLGHARDAVTRLYRLWPTPDGIPHQVEMVVEDKIEGVRWVGRVDRVERTGSGLRVVDYKTGKQPPSIADAARSVQLGFYARAVAAATGERVVSAEMWFPRKEQKSLCVRSFDLDLLDEVEETMALVTRSILDEDWTPTVGAGCQRCDFKRSCPAWPEGRGAFLP